MAASQGYVTLRPDGAGAYYSSTDTHDFEQYPDADAFWDKVDEETADDCTTFIYLNELSSTVKRSFTLSAAGDDPGGTIGKFYIAVRSKKGDGNGAAADCFAGGSPGTVNVHSGLYLGGNVDVSDQGAISSTWGQVGNQIITSKPGGGTWAWSDLASLEVVVGLTCGAGGIRTGLITHAEVRVLLVPEATTDAASDITGISAKLNGTLDHFWGEDSALSYVMFEWGLTTDYGNYTTAEYNKQDTEAFEFDIEDLLPNTFYHFRAITGSSGGTGYGDDRRFLTLPALEAGVIAGLEGTLRFYVEPSKNQYVTEIGLGGYGRRFSTLHFFVPGAPDPETPPDLSPSPPPEYDPCEMAAEAWNRYLIHVANPTYTPGDPESRAQWDREQRNLYDAWASLHAACTLAQDLRGGATGVRHSATTEELHRGRRPLKDWQPGQTDQAIRRLARSPVHQVIIHDIAFTAVDHNSISWAAGQIKLSTGGLMTVDAGSLDLTATHYIYYTLGDTSLNNSTTFSDALSGKSAPIAMATAVTSPALAKITVFWGAPAGGLDLADIFDANTILKADADNTPVALPVAVQRLVGRITAGVITALTAAQVRTLINVENGSTADQTGAEIVTLLEALAAGARLSHNDGLSDLATGDPHTLYILKSLLTTRGDIVTRNATVPARLGIGGDRQIIVSDATDLAYQRFLGQWALMPQGWEWQLNFPDWTETVTGSGSTIRAYGELEVNTNLTAASTARARGYSFGWWGFHVASIEFYCQFVPRAQSTNGKIWWKFDIDANGDPTDKAFGFRLDASGALKGIVHDGNSLTVVDLNTTLVEAGYNLFMRFIAGDKIYWYVNGVEKGNSANIPTAARQALMYPILCVDNGGDAARTAVDVWKHGWLQIA